jgi:hypothetical protein
VSTELGFAVKGSEASLSADDDDTDDTKTPLFNSVGECTGT